MPIRDELAMNKLLKEPQLKFLNDIIAKGKHLALFVDRSAIYSSLTDIPAAERSAYSTLFQSFGVTYQGETSRLVKDNQDNIFVGDRFNITGLSGDVLSASLDIMLNGAPNRTVTYSTN
jgi:hypothetical protein